MKDYERYAEHRRNEMDFEKKLKDAQSSAIAGAVFTAATFIALGVAIAWLFF